MLALFGVLLTRQGLGTMSDYLSDHVEPHVRKASPVNYQGNRLRCTKVGSPNKKEQGGSLQTPTHNQGPFKFFKGA
jgi:hypothetical protein